MDGVTPAIRQVQALDAERYVSVRWEDGTRSLYPYVWLRDNCQCAHCFLHSAKARKLLLTDLDVTTRLERVTLTEPTKVSVVWPDQHTSEFDAEWLKKRCFSQSARQKQQEELFLNARHCWGSGLRVPTASFEEVVREDEAAFAWLHTLRRVGIVLLKGAPVEQGQVTRLSKRIGYHRLTFYGHTWQVQDKADANNVAYTSEKLSLHSDYPALHNPPGVFVVLRVVTVLFLHCLCAVITVGLFMSLKFTLFLWRMQVQFLHCIKQAAEGGESEIVDGFHTANQLRKENPEAFRLLTSLRVDFTDTGADYCDFQVQSKNTIIDHTIIKRVIVKQKQKVTNGLYPTSCDVVTFDNWRLLHGRRSYTSVPGHARHLEGVYLDWDEVMSRLRVLRTALNREA
ncbi:Gamma-butyrobetaine dioxygenase [Acipenser ruthenus]|uniref:Gamma-butyrobetaine dioxygenase n=1 Tax=Acipenser ruthenus TaxID=7906 RepID=A0A444UEB6_ACIRT|nr:Gamma-butyrobetaine dioxygenase [Acipenser ruthenus]